MAKNKKWMVIVALAIVTLVYMARYQPIKQPDNYLFEYEYDYDENAYERERNLHNWRDLSDNQTQALCKLGRILYLDEEVPKVNSSKEYTILVWKYGETIEKRHIYHFTNTRHDPFEKCSVKNCRLTYKDEAVSAADLVIIHLHRTKGVGDLPPKEKRKESQIWAFLTDESPYHTFLNSKSKLKDFNGVFNWSMTYRMDSDIPVPYGRTVPLKDGTKTTFNFKEWKNSKRRDVLVSIMGSNCGSKNHRWEYEKELSRHIMVDAYGKCGTLKCPGHFESDCAPLGDYTFYLSFENSNCDEYITEKLWWNAYHKNAIPVVMGASQSSYRNLLPPHSYINVEDFATPRDLANYLVYLNRTPSELAKYFRWKRRFEIRNEHGYFKSDSFHYCRVCEALNYNSGEGKVYADLGAFWSKDDCHPGWDLSS